MTADWLLAAGSGSPEVHLTVLISGTAMMSLLLLLLRLLQSRLLLYPGNAFLLEVLFKALPRAEDLRLQVEAALRLVHVEQVLVFLQASTHIVKNPARPGLPVLLPIKSIAA